MASWTTFLCLALTLLFYTQSSLGMITCEDLDENSCAFAVSSSGYRCVLEMKLKRSGNVELFCRTSDIEAEKVKDYVENDKCIKACGLDRNTVGISSDSLLDSRFTQKLCSPECYNTCSNIVDLYFNLAAGEGAFLPKLCEDQETNVRRGISEIRSSGIEAARPVSVSEKSVAWPPFAWPPIAVVEEDLASENAEPPC